MLATVVFSSAKDDQGNVIEFTPRFTTGLTQCLVFHMPIYLIANIFTILAPLRSSPAVFLHVLMSIQDLWMLYKWESSLFFLESFIVCWGGAL
jgi:hypothetical protein